MYMYIRLETIIIILACDGVEVTECVVRPTVVEFEFALYFTGVRVIEQCETGRDD